MFSNIITSQKYIAAILFGAALCFGVCFALPQYAAAQGASTMTADEMQDEIDRLIKLIEELQDRHMGSNKFFDVDDGNKIDVQAGEIATVFEADWEIQAEDTYVNKISFYAKPNKMNAINKPWLAFDEAELHVDGVEVGSIDLSQKSNWRRVFGKYVIDVFNGNVRIDAGDSPNFEVIVEIDGATNGDEWNIGIPYQGVTLWTESKKHKRVGRWKEYNELRVVSALPSFGLAGLEVGLSNDNPDATIFEVDTVNESPEYDVFGFDIEETNAVDVTVEDLRVTIVAKDSGGNDLDETLVVDEAILYHNGTELSLDEPNSSGVVNFENIDLEIDADSYESLMVALVFNEAEDYGENVAVKVEFTSILSAEDENGNDESDINISGSAVSAEHTLASKGVAVEVVDTDTDVKDTNGGVAGGEHGYFFITFDVTAIGEDVYIPKKATRSGDLRLGKDKGFEYVILNADGYEKFEGKTAHSISSSADTAGNYYVVQNGESEEFILKIVYEPESDGFWSAQLFSIHYGNRAANPTRAVRAHPEEDFETAYVDLDVADGVVVSSGYTEKDIVEIKVTPKDSRWTRGVVEVELVDGKTIDGIVIAYPSSLWNAAYRVAEVLRKNHGFDFSAFSTTNDRSRYLKDLVELEQQDGTVLGISISTINYTQAAALLVAIEDVIENMLAGL